MTNESARGYFYIFTAVFLFSTVEVAAKLIHRLYGPSELDHWQLAFLRFLFAGLFLTVVLAARGQLRLAFEALRRDPLPLLFLGILGIYLTFTLYYWGLERTRASTAAVVFCANPVFTAALARPMLKENFRWWAWVGVALGLAGAALAVLASGSGGLPARSEIGGGVAVLASALSWSIYTIVGKRYSERYGETPVSFGGIVIGAALFLATILLRGDAERFLYLHPNTWIICIYIGVVTVGVAYLFYFGGLRRVPASSGASLFFLKPSLAVLLAWLILGESPGPLWLSVAFSSAGIFLTTRGSAQEEWVED